MISFFYNLLLLARTVIAGFRNDPEFRAIAILLVFLLLGGSVFFHQVQGWPLLDSLYFCVMTISTIGYGDLAPTMAISKVFTMAYAVLGIGLFATFVGKLVTLRINQRENRKAQRREKKHKSI
jgi:hypothetical protein